MRIAAAIALAASLLAAGGSVRAELLRGFVVGHLVKTWCTRETAIDREACYSYLRGVFDTLNAVAAGGEAGASRGTAGVHCIPMEVPVTELRAVVLRYIDANPDALSRQASRLVIDAWQENYSSGC